MYHTVHVRTTRMFSSKVLYDINVSTFVSYIVLSEEMQKGVALLQWDPAEELTGEAKTKFTDNEQFPVWFDNGDTTIMRMNPY